MQSQRQLKFGKLIQKDLGEIFLQNSRNLFENNFITIVGVEVSPDLGVAKVFLSVFPAKEKEQLLELIRSHGKEIRKHLATRIKNQVRKIPELLFFMDDSLEKVWHMEEIFKKINNS